MSTAIAALFGMMYEYGDTLEETVFKNIEELNAVQKYDYISLIKENEKKLLEMYARTKDLLDE
jgi:hypothetical protein